MKTRGKSSRPVEVISRGVNPGPEQGQIDPAFLYEENGRSARSFFKPAGWVDRIRKMLLAPQGVYRIRLTGLQKDPVVFYLSVFFERELWEFFILPALFVKNLLYT